MGSKRVKLGATYRYQPVMIDVVHPPHGVKAGTLSPGDLVVVQLPGCPPPNTMQHAHINGKVSEEFAGLVHVRSLVPVGGGQ